MPARRQPLSNGIWHFFCARLVFSGTRLFRQRAVPLLRNLEARILSTSHLFDETHYLATCQDARESRLSALAHYVHHGAGAHLDPHPLFDTRHYARQAGSTLKPFDNPVIHYLCVGAAAGIDPSPWFDRGYYVEANHDVRRAGIDPFMHFVRYGMAENRPGRPNSRTEPSRPGNPMPILKVTPGSGHRSPTAFQEYEASPSELMARISRSGVDRASSKETGAVDVIVPVYRGHRETLACLASVLASINQTPFRLIVIDDASPVPELASDLESLAAEGRFHFIRNPTNLGFVASANLGMVQNKAADVVLLNADTEVHGNWLDRMRHTAHISGDVATVTPFTNNGTICSYPHFTRGNPAPLEVSYRALDRIAAKMNAGCYVPIPTAVGFCMYIRRDALDDVGLFDVGRFGRGYGEENDFCLRATALGWRHLLAADTFVRHLGETSFGAEERGTRSASALKTIEALYPGYQQMISEFCARDPARPFRVRLDQARLDAQRGDRNILLVCHERGGGTERHLGEEVKRLRSKGWSSFILRPSGATGARVLHPNCWNLPNLARIDLAPGSRGLVDLVQDLKIERIHVHHLVDFPANMSELIVETAAITGADIDFTVHDYFVICPRINLARPDGTYCGEHGRDQCRACIASLRTGPDALPDIETWRSRHYGLLAKAREVFVPDEDVRARLSRYFTDITLTIRPHETGLKRPIVPVHGPPPGRDGPHVVVLGAISTIKGLEVLEGCARIALRERMRIRFTVIGYTSRDAALKRLGVTVTGPYCDSNLPRMIAEADPNLIWLPSICPETYSYTLSAALAAGRPVCAFDIGAIASRLRAQGTGHLVELSRQDDHRHILQTLVAISTRSAAPPMNAAIEA